MNTRLSDELRQVVADNHGFAQVDGADGPYVVMSLPVFREILGVSAEEELHDTLAAIDRGLADADAGRLRPFREVLAELGPYGSLQR